MNIKYSLSFLSAFMLFNFSTSFLQFEEDPLKQLEKLKNMASYFETKTEFDNLNTKAVPTINVTSANLAAIDDYITRTLACTNTPAASLGIVQLDANDNIIAHYGNAYGRVDPANLTSRRPTADTRFCIGSCTKQFTAHLLGQLLSDKGFTSLYDTPLSQLVGPVEASFYENERNVNQELFTLRDILSHRTAVPRWDLGITVIDRKTPRETIWKNLHYLTALNPLSSNWRSSFNYNNWMYALAGNMIQILSQADQHTTWESLIQAHYFDALNMTKTTFTTSAHKFVNFALTALRNDTAPANYSTVPPLWLNQYREGFGYVNPAGAICSTANDMIKYMAYILTQNQSNAAPNTPLKKFVNLARLPSNLLPQHVGYYEPIAPVIDQYSYGFGWFQGVYRGYKTVGHSGSILGYLTSLTTYPGLRLGVYLSTTSDMLGPNTPYDAVSMGVVDLLLGLPQLFTKEVICTAYNPPTTKKSISPQSNCDLNNTAANRKLSGTYENPLWGAAIISVVNGSGPNKIQLKFDEGIVLHGCLVPLGNGLMLIYFTGNGLGLALNQVSIFKLQFQNYDQNGVPQSFVNYGLETRITKSVTANTFYRAHFDPCHCNPCQNGATCQPTPNYQYTSYTCSCTNGFSGHMCQTGPRKDCSDLYRYHKKTNDGIYWIYPLGVEPIQVYCQFDINNSIGWTVIQRRTEPEPFVPAILFNNSLSVYQKFFGSLTISFWLGLDNIHNLASLATNNYIIHVDLYDCSGQHVFEEYSGFWLDSAANQYKFHINTTPIGGTAGNGFAYNVFLTQNNVPFSTYDHDLDMEPNSNCAAVFKGGWWYNRCYAANLNGAYYSACSYGIHVYRRDGIEWIPWKKVPYTLKEVQIKIGRKI